VCYDLAEVYAITHQATLGQNHYRLGVQLATNLGHEKLQQDLAELAQQYPLLATPPMALTERQQQVLDYVREHGKITNRDYRELTGISQKQAVRDLSDLVEKGLLREDGQGRARRYVGN
jgi:predicted HTH transcriptional regulator